MVRVMDAQEKKWQRESDAHTLAEAQVIKKDKTRHKGAVKEAKVMARKQQRQAQALNNVAKQKPGGRAIVNSNTKTPVSKLKNKR